MWVIQLVPISNTGNNTAYTIISHVFTRIEYKVTHSYYKYIQRYEEFIFII